MALFALETAITACDYSERLTIVEGEDIEIIWLKLKLKDNPCLLIIGCAYRPPESNCVRLTSSLEQCLQKLKMYASSVALTGDFNACYNEWLE